MVDVRIVVPCPEFFNEAVLGFQKLHMNRLQFGQLGDMRLGRLPAVTSDLAKLCQECRLEGVEKARQLAHPRKRRRVPYGPRLIVLCHEVQCLSGAFRDSRDTGSPTPRSGEGSEEIPVFQLGSTLPQRP